MARSMWQVLQRASASIAESPRYRYYPVYALLIALIARVTGYWPVDFLWWMALLGNPALDTLHLSSVLLPLWMAVVLGSVGLFRRGRLARLVSLIAIGLALDGVARWYIFLWHPVERLQDTIYAITVGLPLDFLMRAFDGDHITVTQVFALYLVVAYFCLRPLLRRGVGRLAARIETMR